MNSTHLKMHFTLANKNLHYSSQIHFKNLHKTFNIHFKNRA